MLARPSRALAPGRRPAENKCRSSRPTAAVAPARVRDPSMAVASAPEDAAFDGEGGGGGCTVSDSEWQAWGTASPVPAMVSELVGRLRALERDLDTKMSFGGIGSKLQGDFKVHEDKKQRAVYETLTDSEEKLQFFSARQVACRLLGSRGYLCQKCWLPMEDCMCSRVVPCALWSGIRFWLYMHPKDFLRQNNTGKLLWQLFGVQSASLCLFGIQEHEDIMWDAFRDSGEGLVWFLYPNKNTSPKMVWDVNFDGLLTSSEVLTMNQREKHLNFVLLDGTWSNSAAMYRRLKERWMASFGGEDLPCISLSTLGASVMHKLRPQPAWDRTCTAAAAAGLLSELHLRPELETLELDKQAEAVECSLNVLLDALTARRLRMGRSITRKERQKICL